MGYLVDILIGAASRIVIGELSAHLEPLALWIINKAVERIPSCERERFREEWVAHLNETPGSLRKLLHALGCRIAATAISGVLVRERKEETVIQQTRAQKMARQIVSEIRAIGLAEVDWHDPYYELRLVEEIVRLAWNKERDEA